MADPLEEIAANTLLSLSQHRILPSIKDQDGSKPPLTLPPLMLPTPPLSDEQGRTPAGSPPTQTQKLQYLEPVVFLGPPSHPSPPFFASKVETTDSQLSFSHREEITQPKRPVFPVRGLFHDNKLPPLPPLPSPPLQLSYHADGTWQEGAAAAKLVLANLPNIGSYEGDMLWMKNALEDKITKLCNIWEVLEDSQTREEHEKMLMFHMDSIFKLAGTGDGQKMSTLKQERGRMQHFLNWLSPLIQFYDPNGPFQPRDHHRVKVQESPSPGKQQGQQPR
ncbi:hypothetical protein IL306_014462 [Fusarium sp. DS 682]|nr:hypothetical protein IL306_014462 [Fusarium sp. DS 682]